MTVARFVVAAAVLAALAGCAGDRPEVVTDGQYMSILLAEAREQMTSDGLISGDERLRLCVADDEPWVVGPGDSDMVDPGQRCWAQEVTP